MTSPGLFHPSEALAHLIARSDFPAALVSPPAATAIRSLADRLPNAMYASGFECRLAPGASHVDFATWVTPSSGGVEALAELRAGDPGGDLLEHPEWRRLCAFCRTWVGGDAEIARRLEFAILEFDVGRPGDAALVPSIFLGLAPKPRLLLGLESPDAADVRWLADRCLGRLRGAELPPAIRGQLERCHRALPPGGAFLHVAALLSRAVDAVRVYATAPAGGIASYLKEIGLGDAAPELLALWRRCAADADRVAFQFDVAAEVGARASVELPLASALSDRSGLDAATVLRQLESAGLCAPEKRAALLGWPAIQPIEGCDEQIVRELSHLKVARDAAGTLEAKGYFYFTHTHASRS